MVDKTRKKWHIKDYEHLRGLAEFEIWKKILKKAKLSHGILNPVAATGHAIDIAEELGQATLMPGEEATQKNNDGCWGHLATCENWLWYVIEFSSWL